MTPTIVDFFTGTHVGLAFGVVNKHHKNGHSGQDYKNWSAGTTIPSPVAGTVSAHIFDNPDRPDRPNHKDLGNVIVVETEIGWFSFCHLESFDGVPAVGSAVAVNTDLGPVGNTGFSKGNHVHVMFSRTSNNPITRHGIEDPAPVIAAACRHPAAGLVIPPPEEDMLFVLRSDGRGEWLIGPNHAHHLTPDEANQINSLRAAPGQPFGTYPVYDCGANDLAFDLIRSAHATQTP